jgi:hypothetical protein
VSSGHAAGGGARADGGGASILDELAVALGAGVLMSSRRRPWLLEFG